MAVRLADAGVDRIAVGGGETSGAVVTALGIGRLRIGPEIDPGVPALAAEGRRRMNLALKSGNFGADDFFAKALSMLKGSLTCVAGNKKPPSGGETERRLWSG